MFVGCAKLSKSSTAAGVEVLSPSQLSPSMLMPAAAGGSFLLRLDQQQVGDIGQHLALPPATRPQCAVSAVSQQPSSGLSPNISQLVLCPTPSQFAYQSTPLTIAAAGTTTTSNSAAAQFCTVLGPVTSVPLLPVSALVQSVQFVPAAVGVSVPISPVFVAGNVSGPSALFMVPN